MKANISATITGFSVCVKNRLEVSNCFKNELKNSEFTDGPEFTDGRLKNLKPSSQLRKQTETHKKTVYIPLQLDRSLHLYVFSMN